MLPQVQVHPPPMYSTSHPRQQYSSSFPAPGLTGRSYGATHVTSSTLSFPIRTSQHGSSILTNASTSPYTGDSEHRLRRKTPKGTIDAAYDASPLRCTDGPPPYKQVILPPSSLLQSYPPNPSLQSFNRSTSALDIGSIPRGCSFDGRTMLWPWDHCPIPPTTPKPGTYSQLWEQQLGSPQYIHRTTIQPVLRANENNVRAFCPPSMPATAMLPFGQLEWPVMSWQGDSHRPNPPVNPFNVAGMPCATTLHSLAGYSSPTPAAWVAQPLPSAVETPFPPTSGINNQLGPYGHAHNPELLFPQPGFRDKVLAQAHSHYVELLSYTQAARKDAQCKSGHSTRSSFSLFLYPKPPNPSRVFRDPEISSKDASYSLSSGFGGRSALIDSALVSSNHNLTGHQIEIPRRSSQWGYDPSSVIRTRHNVAAVNDASSSLEMLTNMCEQSGWKWTEGMLLGGCLLYGLERYDDAFEWFSRIIALDQRHVESITNAAAALYCLDRKQEAEQYWLRAVRLRPSYLEAAEHLVGLLYRKRSKDAIEVVAFVQEALRMPQSKSHQDDAFVPSNINTASQGDPRQLSSPTTTQCTTHNNHESNLGVVGFGSSGYALPSRENGRILALVHAKATMLYGLKEINKAAEAFEEAVLISVGRTMMDVHHLVHVIQAVLMPSKDSRHFRQSEAKSVVQPLLLTPDKARQTARLVFCGNGELPGLQLVPNGPSKRAATQTTSNSLLSLAKIFQDAISHGGPAPRLLRSPPGIGDILALYYLSLSLQESPSTANNVGILLAGVQSELSPPTADSFDYPTVPGVTPGSGLALALAYYQYGLRLDSKHVHLHTNLGSLLKDIGQLDLAIQMYEQAVSCDSTFDIALTNLANAVKDRGRIQDAITYYKRAVQANPDFAEAVCGLFTALNSVCDWRGRGGMLLPDRRYDRWHVDEDGTLIDARTQAQSSGLAQRVTEIVKSQLSEASRWGLHTLQDDVLNELVNQLHGVFDGERHHLVKALRQWAGRPWEGSRIVRLVERACRVLQRRCYIDKLETISPDDAARRYHGLATGQHRRPRLPSTLTVPSAPTVLPFHTFTCPLTASDVRAISQRNALRISCSTLRSTWLPDHIYPPPSPPKPHLNIGYISSDFNNHPLAHLMQSVFGFHNPHRVRAHCYATTIGDGSSHRLKIEKEAPVFRDVSNWSPNRLTDQISQDNIHVLVNLNGYTRGARNEIFAARPAPVQMSFMGFAGSLGAEWCDYLLADLTAVPIDTLRPWRANTALSDVLSDESESSTGDWIYSENIIFCRDTFFCCDHAQSAELSERDITWATEQERRWAMRRQLFPNLDDDVIILGNFNQLYKIEPTTFRAWLRILDQVPKAILWLLRFPEPGEHYLRSTANAWAGEEVAKRLIFTDVAPKSQHISRARVCDLFLDTPECNAHTTAADVLWSSTPLLTLPRYPYKMCSRMAASILRGALPNNAEGDEAATDLIASSEEQYEASAVALAGGLKYDTSTGIGLGTGRLADLRKLLWDSKWTCGLFDTRRWVAEVEDAYEIAWRHWVEGKQGDIFL